MMNSPSAIPEEQARESQAAQSPGHRVTGSSFQLPREGFYWLVIALALLSIGLLKGINLLLLLACLMVALWGLNAVLAGRRLGRLQGRRSIDGPVFAQAPFRAHFLVTNPRPALVLGVRVEDRGSDHQLAWFVPRLEGQQSAAFQQTLTLPRRGPYRWEPLLASSGYPFGLVRRRQTLAPEEKIIVLPALGRLHRGRLRCYLAPVGYSSAYARGAGRRDPSAQAEFHGLRVFRSGDSPRSIHWRTSARCGELMVREYEDVPNDNLILILDPSSAAFGARTAEGEIADNSTRRAPNAALDTIISLAATVCWEWCRQKGDYLALIVAGPEPVVIDGVTGPELALRALECLAVQTGRAPASADALLDYLQSQPLAPAPVLLLSGRPSALGELLGQRLGRPVAALDALALAEVDFYEPPLLPSDAR
jgi:uncharacterized protein (DUF58 family)